MLILKRKYLICLCFKKIDWWHGSGISFSCSGDIRSESNYLRASAFFIVTNAMTAYVADIAIRNKNGIIVEV